MKKTLSLLAALLLVFSAMLYVQPPAASALSCAEPRPVDEEAKQSKMVFKGTLIAKDEHTFTFRVATWWKGNPSETRMVLHGNGWADFETGKEYVVFTSTRESKPTPHLCGNTGPAVNVSTQLLGPGYQAGYSGMLRTAWQMVYAPGGIVPAYISIVQWLQPRLS